MAECIIYTRRPPIDAATLRRARSLSTSVISDSFGRWAGAPGIGLVAGLGPAEVVAGTALTVRTRPGDNLVVHKALDLARPDDVLVVAAGGAEDRAILGGLMGKYATTQGVSAIVVDGAVRDLSALSRDAPPTFARSLCHLGPHKDGSGEIHGKVSVAGLVISDGDLVVGDGDGVTAVPRERIAWVLAAAEEKQGEELSEERAIADGEWDRRWIDEALDIRYVGTVSDHDPLPSE